MTDNKVTVPEVLPLVNEYYRKPGNGAGGHLHIVLDDRNIGDSFVEYCLDRARQDGDEDGVRLAQLLLKMSKTQRRKICASHDGGFPL